MVVAATLDAGGLAAARTAAAVAAMADQGGLAAAADGPRSVSRHATHMASRHCRPGGEGGGG